MNPLVQTRPEGLYCAAGDFYIDPWRPVARALITHGHADHARRGVESYLCVSECVGILRARLGDVRIQNCAYGENLHVGDANVSFHAAGHVLGSAQIRIEVAGEIWVISGDYKCAPNFAAEDTTCAPFAPVRCHTFITESTFGLPIYQWRAQADVMNEINAWWSANQRVGATSVIYAYGLGKAQRVLAHVDTSIGPIFCHSAVMPINEAYADAGVRLPKVQKLSETTNIKGEGALLIIPPSAKPARWPSRYGDVSDATASGWLQLRGARRRQSVDRGFVLSDHADWPGLLQAIDASGADQVLVTHGQVAPLVRHLRGIGLNAMPLSTAYGDEEHP